jgi:helicase
MPPIDVPELVRATNGFSAYNPMQRQALSAGLFDKNLVIASPTASGKTIIAELSGLDSILNRKKKAIYLAPLRALASEHYRDFKQKYGASQRIRFGISTGDFDSSSQYLSKYDMIFCTNEKLDSLLRHKAEWLSQVGLLIVDEVHLLGSDRGPVLEMVLTQFRHLNPAVRIVALSATIPNSDAIAQWLSATLVQSDYRPVPLSEGVYFDGEIRFRDRVETLDNTERDAVKALVADTLHKKNKQVLVFANTRPAAQQAAKKLAAVTVRSLSDAQKQRLQKASRAILSALEQPTDQCKLLAGLVAEGAAFHHAGLVEKQRRVVESAFKKNLVKVICATPTLAAGINLPAYRVLISSTYRYGENGSERISVSEYKQMAGRSGRPKYDDRGEAIMLSSSVTETDFLLDHYANGALEDIESRLGVEPVLRTHLLATIANAYVSDLDSLQSFFSKTFYCHQFGSIDSLLATLIDVKDHLQEIGFVHESDKKFVATPLGKRVSELYLDPVSARQILDGLDTRNS